MNTLFLVSVVLIGCVSGLLAGTVDAHGSGDSDFVTAGAPARQIDYRWLQLMELTAGNTRYDDMNPLDVFEAFFGERPPEADVPRRPDCQGVSWGEIKDCFRDGGSDLPNDDPGGGEDPSEPPVEPDPPDGPGDGE
jgi:hypothetical protein